MVKSLDKELFGKLLLIYYVVWCIIPFFTLRENTGMFWSQLVWFVVMYFTGAYIRIIPAKYSKRFYVHALWLSSVLLVLSVIAITWLSGLKEELSNYITYFRWSNSPLIVIICLSMVRLADMAPVKTISWINFLGSLVLGIYLFQENKFFQDICWNEWFNNTVPITIPHQIAHVIISVVGVFVIGGLIEFIRIRIFKLFSL